MRSGKHLGILGAGPKALAVAAKVSVLSSLGFEVPNITIFEKSGIANNWTLQSGLTDGQHPLGTPPDKDLGFPYLSFCWGDRFNDSVNQKMQEFSWQSFLVEKRRYSDWIDRGKPAPTHGRWAEYLQWALQKVSTEVKIVIEEICSAELDDDRWKINGKSHLDGLIVTGPGLQSLPGPLPQDDRIYTIDRFWPRCENLSLREGRVAIVGTGESAASIAVALLGPKSKLHVDIISPFAMNFSRGESYVENHIYTDPFQGNWFQLTWENRRDIINRTDRGVFSNATKKVLDLAENLEIIPGRVEKVSVDKLNQVTLDVEYDSGQEKRIYDFVVVATGFDHMGFLKTFLSHETTTEICRRSGLESFISDAIERAIQEDMSIIKLRPKLHLPILAGMAQGPGFSNLSCLGRLSDQILSAYVPVVS